MPSITTITATSNNHPISNNKSKINFIEKNKRNVIKNKIENESIESENSIVISVKCLNELSIREDEKEEPEEVALITTTSKFEQEEEEENIKLDISVISAHSSIFSNNDNKNNETKTANIIPKTSLVQGTTNQNENEEKEEEEEGTKLNISNDENEEEDSSTGQKAKVRSQFMQRFGSSNVNTTAPTKTCSNNKFNKNKTKPKQIIPNLVNHNQNHTCQSNSSSSLKSSYEIENDHDDICHSNSSSNQNLINNTMNTKEFFNMNRLHRGIYYTTPQIIEQEQTNSNQINQVASLTAAVTAQLTQPIAKMQSDIEYKISNVLKELEMLRKSNDNNNFKQNFEIEEPKIKETPHFENNNLSSYEVAVKSKSKSKSPSSSKTNNKKKTISKKLNRSSLSSRSRSPSLSSCEVCDRGRTRQRSLSNKRRESTSRSTSSSHHKHINKKNSKTKFLQNLLDNEDKNSSLQNELPPSSLLDAYDNRPLLFDKYLNQVKNPPKIQHNFNLTEQDSIETNNSSSMFSDIKQVLKAVEESKSKIDTRLNEIIRQRENNHFYTRTLSNELNNDSNNNDYSRLEVEEQRRTRKLVDGCINAITTDVQRIVEQKLIDESRHVKLVAERDSYNNTRKKVSIPLRTKSVEIKINNNNKQSATATASQTKKYLNQIYGPTFLTQLKREEQEIKQKEMREQIEKQREMEKLKRQQQFVLKNKKNLPKPKPIQTQPTTTIPTPSASNSAFLTIPFKSFEPMNGQRSRSTSHEKKHPKKSNNNNVGLINIITHSNNTNTDTTTSAKELRRQDLPSVNIQPSSLHNDIQTETTPAINNPSDNNNSINNLSVHLNDEDNLNINQKGTGISIINNQNNNKINLNTKFDIKLNDSSSKKDEGGSDMLSNETNEFIRIRNAMERQTFEWLEQELLSHFINKMAIDQTNFNEQEEVYQNEGEDENLELGIDPQTLMLMNFVGKKGFQLFVDMGLEVDPNLIELLIREVLEEKIANIISSNNENENDQNEENVEETVEKPQPQPSPRKTLEYIEKHHHNINRPLSLEIETPVPTPPILKSPSSPSKINNTIQQPIVQPPILPPQSHQEIITKPKQKHYILIEEEENFSELDVTLEEEEEEAQEQDFSNRDNTKQSNGTKITIPPTPRATPSPPPLDNNDESESFVTPPLPIPPKPITKELVNTSVQCDPLVVVPPIPKKTDDQPKIKLNQTKPTLINIISETILDHEEKENDDDLTESTKTYISSSTTTTLSTTASTTTNTQSLNGEEDSYFSDGVWLMSKSEGEIVLGNDDNEHIVNLDMNRAVNSVFLNPHKKKNAEEIEEDGELKLNDINQVNMMLYGKSKTIGGVNRIMRQNEIGEVVNRASEGEVDSGTAQIQNSKIKAKKSKSKKNKSVSEKEEEKTKISLRIDSSSLLSKNTNKIKIQPLALAVNKQQSVLNEVFTRDSLNSDFERRMFSSTPDNSMILNSQNSEKKKIKSRSRKVINQEDEEDDDEDFLEEGEFIINENTSISNNMNSSLRNSIAIKGGMEKTLINNESYDDENKDGEEEICLQITASPNKKITSKQRPHTGKTN